ncbi:hypothetical protein QFC19_005161 [Naganishia cerealis]|uniref:Uncharacterized protein n=1 Tax=Naganishia cerealis TaxID=610337 RepID=A0ACC2VQX1_9TREE|nr:hypothetical protein QFC19_005161 [Naganishia cerealis]
MATTNNSATVTTEKSPRQEAGPHLTEPALNEKEKNTLSGIENENRNPADEPPFEYTLEEDKRVLRKVDCWVLPVLCLTYMVQQLCKSALPWASAFDLREYILSTSFCVGVLIRVFNDHSSSDASSQFPIQLVDLTALHRPTRIPARFVLCIGQIPHKVLGPAQPVRM